MAFLMLSADRSRASLKVEAQQHSSQVVRLIVAVVVMLLMFCWGESYGRVRSRDVELEMKCSIC